MCPIPRSLLLAALLLGSLSPTEQVRAQQPVPPADTSGAETPLVDSLRAALDQFEEENAPAVADSAVLRQLADSLRAAGDSLTNSDPKRARLYVRPAQRAYRALADSAGIAKATNTLGKAYETLGRYNEALDRYRKTLEIHRAAGNQQGTAEALKSIGVVHWYQGRYEKALAHYQEALDLFREVDDRDNITNTLYNIGLVQYNQGRYEEALVRYREALSTFREIDDLTAIAAVLNAIGLVHQKQGRYDRALPRYREALETWQQIGHQRGTAATLHNIGIVYKTQGRYDEALTHYREALKIRRELGNRGGTASTLNSIGLVYYNQDRYDKAVDRVQEALRINREIERLPRVANNLRDLGKLRLAQGQSRAAADTLTKAVRLAEQLRRNAISPEARRSWLTTQINAYRALTTAQVRLGRPDSALRSVEQTRARLLAERLAGTARGDTAFNIPSVEELRRTLGPDEAALLYGDTERGWPLTALAVTQDSVYAHELPDSTFRASVAEAYPTQLNRLRRQEGPLTAAMRAKQAGTGGQTPTLAATIRLYRYHLTRRRSDTSVRRDLARRFHRLLVEPIAGHVQSKDELIVVPTGTLGYLPFETLRDASGMYLAEEKHVRYAQSLTVLRQLQQRNYAERERPLLAFGGAAYEPDPTLRDGMLVAEARRGSTRVATSDHASTLLRSAERQMEQGKSPRRVYQQLGYGGWPDLPGTKSEAEKLGELVGKTATVVTGAGASEDSIRALDEKGQLSEYRLIHFATHGVAVPETPELSALVLSQIGASDSLAAQDGYLTMEEIAGLKMKADVAVLSACQTGLGKVVAGEGVVSLSHAFLRAGSNATLVSQWKVLDESTRQFMTAVYKRAKNEDTSFAEAVTLAKRAFIAGEYGEKNTDPLRWGPFVYYGRE